MMTENDRSKSQSNRTQDAGSILRHSNVLPPANLISHQGERATFPMTRQNRQSRAGLWTWWTKRKRTTCSALSCRALRALWRLSLDLNEFMPDHQLSDWMAGHRWAQTCGAGIERGEIKPSGSMFQHHWLYFREIERKPSEIDWFDGKLGHHRFYMLLPSRYGSSLSTVPRKQSWNIKFHSSIKTVILCSYLDATLLQVLWRAQAARVLQSTTKIRIHGMLGQRTC